MSKNKSHEFGGSWTREKLERVRKYLSAYTTILRIQTWAITTYVDAFAGAGHRLDSSKGEPIDTENEEFLKGSAIIALEVDPSFDNYLFIEQNKNRVAELGLLKEQFPDKSKNIQIINAEANEFLREWCEEIDWKKNRAVVFLDPYGMQVEWTLIEAIAKTRAIDLWILFPLGMGVNRLLTKGVHPPEEWGRTLTRFFGTEEWKEIFYSTKENVTLFGTNEYLEKDADFDKIGKYFVSRLKTIFAHVAPKPLPLRNSTNNPLYLLCFAANNATAVKIANDILRK